MAKLKLDLHEICKNGKLIEKELNRIIDEACEKRIALVEIISGKGSGQLKKAVLRFLERPDIKIKH
ncbi:MAG: Smr/MutS family protein [Planctomycetota bacterium]|jgi:dsDNA-specific endonuclease/ATPase MutS2